MPATMLERIRYRDAHSWDVSRRIIRPCCPDAERCDGNRKKWSQDVEDQKRRSKNSPALELLVLLRGQEQET